MDVRTINPLDLPSVELSERATLPDAPGIYFVLSGDSTILYIGRATSIAERWRAHHRTFQLSTMQNIRIAWVIVLDDMDLLSAIEQACIAYFMPTLNDHSVPYYPLHIDCYWGPDRSQRAFLQVRLDYAAWIGRPVSVREVADAVGVSRQFLYAIEQGREKPSWNTVEKLCKFYGVQPSNLLTYKERLALGWTWPK
jgi:DNA-binding XRE family transcriptional regulator